MLGAKNAGEPCVRANYQPLQQLQVLAQNTKDAKPRIMLKAKVGTSRIRECRPVAAFPQICHAITRNPLLRPQRSIAIWFLKSQL